MAGLEAADDGHHALVALEHRGGHDRGDGHLLDDRGARPRSGTAGR